MKKIKIQHQFLKFDCYRLRNPWKTLEYNGYLFVPDVGWASSEELNLVNLEELSKNKTPFIFGWPFFEGSVNNNLTFFKSISMWSNESQLSVITYANEMTTAPIVHYNRPAPDANRAAIVGGDIIKSQDSKYFEHYIFADFLSKELFAYDFKNDALYTFHFLRNLYHTLLQDSGTKSRIQFFNYNRCWSFVRNKVTLIYYFE